MKKVLSIFIFLLPVSLWAQDTYYYHTVHSSSLAAMYGRTYKVHYAYQLSHLRQLKLSGLYVFDEYTQGDGNRIKADVYNLGLQFQYNLLHADKFFFNINLGAGGYRITATDLIGVKFKEWKVNFLGGAQAEFYIQRNRLAIFVDYDVLYFPFSKLYEVLHIPTAGVGVFF